MPPSFDVGANWSKLKTPLAAFTMAGVVTVLLHNLVSRHQLERKIKIAEHSQQNGKR